MYNSHLEIIIQFESRYGFKKNICKVLNIFYDMKLFYQINNETPMVAVKPSATQ